MTFLIHTHDEDIPSLTQYQGHTHTKKKFKIKKIFIGLKDICHLKNLKWQ